MKANEIKKGSVILVDGHNIIVKQLHVQSPSSRSGSTLYKIKGQNVVTGQKFERSFKGDETVLTVDFARRAVKLLYRDASGCTFMDTESYEQYTVDDKMIAEELQFLTEETESVFALIVDEALLGIEVPTSILMEIVECAPAIKGASASARTKPATLVTGLVIQVPEYLKPGEIIKINTDTKEFMSRG